MDMRVILTGHSKGMGAGLAAAFSRRDLPVLGLSRNALATALPGVHEIALDLADTGALLNWLAGGALAEFCAPAGQVLLVNNAGVVTPIAPAGRQPGADIARAVALNVTAPLLLSDALNRAAPQARRRIAHISSGAGRKPYPGWSIYCATKAALDMHAQAVAADAIPGLSITSIAPGVIDTAMQGNIRSSAPADFPLLGKFQAMKTDGALASPEEAGEKLAAYFLSDAFGSDLITDIRTL